METTERPAVVGVFRDRAKAAEAVSELQSAGFTEEQIGFAVRSEDGKAEGAGPLFGEKAPGEKEGAAWGALHGGVLGGIVGAATAVLLPGVGLALVGGVLVAALTGAAIGGATGGFLGALTRLKVPEPAAKYYETHFKAGRSIVTVQAGGREEEAVRILRKHGAYDAETRSGDTDFLRAETVGES